MSSLTISQSTPRIVTGPHLRIAPNNQGFIGDGRVWSAFEADMWQVNEPLPRFGHSGRNKSARLYSGQGYPASFAGAGREGALGAVPELTRSDSPESDEILLSPPLGRTAPIKTVLKLCYPNRNNASLRSGEYSTVEEEEEAVVREMRMYENPLKSLQGHVVPNCYFMLRSRVQAVYDNGSHELCLKGCDDVMEGEEDEMDDDEGGYVYAMVLQRLGPPIHFDDELGWGARSVMG